MAYPDPRTALATERIADWQREAARRGTVLAALRTRRIQVADGQDEAAQRIIVIAAFSTRRSRIADLRRAVARRCIIRAMLRARRRRLAAASDARQAVQRAAAAFEPPIEHLYDKGQLAASGELLTQPERQ